MDILLISAVAVVHWSETNRNPLLAQPGVDSVDANMEGKEVRFRQATSALYLAVTTSLGGGQHFPSLALGPIVEHLPMHAGKAL